MSSIIEALDSHDTVIETLRCADWDGLEVRERLEAVDRLEKSGRASSEAQTMRPRRRIGLQHLPIAGSFRQP